MMPESRVIFPDCPSPQGRFRASRRQPDDSGSRFAPRSVRRQSGGQTGKSDRRRRGVSLIELIIVISVATLIIGVALGLMQWLLRSERDVRKTVWYGRSVSRLAQVFRNDAHRASHVEIAAAAETSNSMQFSLGNSHTVTYEIEEHTIRRVDRDGETELHRETFHFPPGSAIRFEKDQGPAMARVVIDRATGQLNVDTNEDANAGARTEPAGRTVRIEAGLGKDRRFSTEGSP